MFYENRLGIKKSVISFVDFFFVNTCTKFCEPYHSNHVSPHHDKTAYLPKYGFGVNCLVGLVAIETEILIMVKYEVFSSCEAGNVETLLKQCKDKLLQKYSFSANQFRTSFYGNLKSALAFSWKNSKLYG